MLFCSYSACIVIAIQHAYTHTHTQCFFFVITWVHNLFHRHCYNHHHHHIITITLNSFYSSVKENYSLFFRFFVFFEIFIENSPAPSKQQKLFTFFWWGKKGCFEVKWMTTGFQFHQRQNTTTPTTIKVINIYTR